MRNNSNVILEFDKREMLISINQAIKKNFEYSFLKKEIELDINVRNFDKFKNELTLENILINSKKKEKINKRLKKKLCIFEGLGFKNKKFEFIIKRNCHGIYQGCYLIFKYAHADLNKSKRLMEMMNQQTKQSTKRRRESISVWGEKTDLKQL